MKHTLSLLLLLACGPLLASEEINPKQWNSIKNVVCKHKSEQWISRFNKKYQTPSEDGVRELAQQLDLDWKDPVEWCNVGQFNHEYYIKSNLPQLARLFDCDENAQEVARHLESDPELLSAKVCGEPIYGLTPGKVTDIMCKVLLERHENTYTQKNE